MSLFGLDDPGLSDTDRASILAQLTDGQRAQLDAAVKTDETVDAEVDKEATK